MRDFYKPLCEHDHDHQTLSVVADHASGLVVQGLADELRKLVGQISYIAYTENKKPTDLLKGDAASEHISAVAKHILSGVTSEFGKSNPDLVEAVKANIFVFSGFKTYQMLKDMSLSLIDEKGKFVSLPKFKEAVKAINSTYNVNWLESEYITANLSARQAAKWEKYQKQADKYDLEYDAVDDSHTSDLCKRLNGVVYAADDKFWNSYYPPNHWRCRSIVRQVSKGSKGKELPDDTSKPENMFNNNVGKKGIIFPDNHPYFKGLTPEEKASVMGSIEKAKSVFDGKILNDNEQFKISKKAIIDNGLHTQYPNLTEDEIASIYHYSSMGRYYIKLNRQLNTPPLDEFNQAFADTLSKALDKLPNYESEVYRGTIISNDILTTYKNAYQSSDKVINHALFTSSSQSGKIAIGFTEFRKLKENEVKAFFVILSKTGKIIAKLSEDITQKEVLFKNNTNFEVSNFEFSESQNTYLITLKEK